MGLALLYAQTPTDFLVLISLATIALLGAVALVSPYHFGLISARGSQWIDSNRIVEKLDQRINVDHHVLRFSRVLGVAVLLSVVYLGYVYFHLFQSL